MIIRRLLHPTHGIALFLLVFLSLGDIARGQSPDSVLYDGEATLVYVRGTRRPDVPDLRVVAHSLGEDSLRLVVRAFHPDGLNGDLCFDLPVRLRAGRFEEECSDCVQYVRNLLPSRTYGARLEGSCQDGGLHFRFELTEGRILGVRLEVAYTFEGHRRE